MSKVPIKEYYNDLCLEYKKKYKKPEEWKILVYNDEVTKYAVSNYGRIFDLEKMRLPSIRLDAKHFKADIKISDNKRKTIGIYRLVALMFIPVPQKYLDAGYTVNELVPDHKRDHDIDNFEDNTIWNLQWLTHRENISKAANCGYRPAYPKDFRNELDDMILSNCTNKEIYAMCKEKYGYEKDEVKGQLQVRRRRLGKTLKEHHERDKAFTQQVDELLMKGLSNDDIIEKLNMPADGRSSTRLLQYRRSLLNIPAQKSKYLSNEDNEKINELFEKGLSTKEIVEYFNIDKKFSEEDVIKFKASLRTRRRFFKQNTSSTTIENIS